MLGLVELALTRPNLRAEPTVGDPLLEQLRDRRSDAVTVLWVVVLHILQLAHKLFERVSVVHHPLKLILFEIRHFEILLIF